MSTPMGASVSCSGVRWPNRLTVGPRGMTEKARKAGGAAMTGARKHTGLAARRGGDDRRGEVDRLVRERRHDVFLERQLQPVGEALQVAARADPVGADPLLHAGDDLALEDDREQRHQDEDHEDPDDLDEHDPPDVVSEVLERRLVGAGEDAHAGPPTESLTMPPGPVPSWDRTSLPGERMGSQTTWS